MIHVKFIKLNHQNMKNIYAFIAVVIGMFTLQSCTKEYITQVTNIEVQVIELTNVNFTSQNNYTRLYTFNPAIPQNDMVLVYLLDNIDNNTDVWRLLPQTYYLDGGLEVDYNFDFTRFDVRLFMDSNNFSSIPLSFSLNQIFRVVILPGYRARSNNAVDFNDFNAVVNAYNLDLSQMKKVRM